MNIAVNVIEFISLHESRIVTMLSTSSLEEDKHEVDRVFKINAHMLYDCINWKGCYTIGKLSLVEGI